MNNYISKKDLEEAYKRMETEPLILNPKLYKSLQEVILENNILQNKLGKVIEHIKRYNSISGYYFDFEANRINDNVSLKEELLEILGDKE